MNTACLFEERDADILIAKDLEPYKLRLEQRATRQAWYELQQPQLAYKEGFESWKIVYPHFAQWPSFTYDVGGHFINDKGYIIPTAEKWLLSILNSTVCAYILGHLCPVVRGGFLEHRVIYMQRLPVPEVNEATRTQLAALVDQLQAMSGQGPDAEQLEHEVDAIVYRTYGLSEEEIAEIERWHVERRAQLGTGRRGQRIIANEEIEV